MPNFDAHFCCPLLREPPSLSLSYGRQKQRWVNQDVFEVADAGFEGKNHGARRLDEHVDELRDKVNRGRKRVSLQYGKRRIGIKQGPLER